MLWIPLLTGRRHAWNPMRLSIRSPIAPNRDPLRVARSAS